MNNPVQIFKDYESGVTFKAGLGNKGIYEQSKVNERFYIGDQWHGAQCGSDRPLVRHNIIKRIGEYKMSVLNSSPVTVNFSADGIPNTLELKKRIEKIRDELPTRDEFSEEAPLEEIPTTEEINLVMSALTDYHKVTAERLKFEDVKETALRNAYISGTGVVYTYWDPDVKTGLYADKSRKTPILGDIACEVLDIENIVFGDPNTDNIEKQPYIIISQRKSVEELRREAKREGRPKADLEAIKPDNDTYYSAGDRGVEPDDSKKATVLTKFWKEYSDDGSNYTIKAKRVCKGAVIRAEWDMGLRMYPLAKFSWERRRNCVYGESEITYLTPNQIAINRMITASVWAVMVMGMPIMVVNNDIVRKPISNDPGQIIRVSGDAGDVAGAIRYVMPPQFSPNFDSNIMSLISNTLSQAGANDAALGNVRPDNTSAIIALREAAMMPMQTVQNRYYQFCEDIARIWAEFWVTKYGSRSIKIEDQNGTWYLPFDGARYRDLLIAVKVDVGASTLWSESQNIKTLDNLFDRQIIDVLQYLKRMPKGMIPDVTGLIKELSPKTVVGGGIPDAPNDDMPPEVLSAMQGGVTGENPVGDGIPDVPMESPEVLATMRDGGQGAPEGQTPNAEAAGGEFDIRQILDSLSPEEREQFLALPREKQIEFLQNALGVTV